MSAQVSILKPAVAANWGNDSPEYAQLAALIAERDALRDKVEQVRQEIESAKHELDTVTATDDAQSDGIGCAENALDRALAVLDRAPGVQS